MGMGVDVHGGDYTKAAKRAVSDALRHSSLNFFAVTDKSHHDMHIEVRIGVAEPDQVDVDAVKAEVPYGTVTRLADHRRARRARSRRNRSTRDRQRGDPGELRGVAT